MSGVVFGGGSGPGNAVFIVIPSMTLDAEELAKIPGAVHFEERMLWLLQTLREPRARVVYVTSEPLPERLVEYSASLTKMGDARERVVLISCDDSAPSALTHKVLARPAIQERIREAAHGNAVMMCHVATRAEEQLARALGAELFACPPDLVDLGTKSASRRAFREAGVPFPDGEEGLVGRADAVEALIALRERQPGLKRAIIKLNDSFAGGGNCVVTYPNEDRADLRVALQSQIDAAAFVAPGETPHRYFEAFARMGGIVEEMVDGDITTSPSVQCIIGSDGTARVTSTHEQILGGEHDQTFFGCRFPARRDYRSVIAESAARIAGRLAEGGVRGHLSIDFVCRQVGARWEHFAIEVNLRMGGATAPISFLELATGGRYDSSTGTFLGFDGRELFYTSADRIQSDAYRSLNAETVLDEADRLGLHLDPKTGSGTIFYMLGALTTVGKLGLVAVDRSPALADQRYAHTVEVLDHLAAST